MKSKFNEELLQLKYDNDLCEEVYCTKEENRIYLEMIKHKQKLPLDILKCDGAEGLSDSFYRVVPFKITHEELQEYCLLKQTKYLKTIKKCVVFFTMLTVVSLVATFIFNLVLYNS